MDEPEEDIDTKRDRSPPFPYLGLTAAIDLTRKMQQVAKSSEVRLAQVAPHWNTTPTSGALARYAGAVQGYGLIESSGSGVNRKIRITDAGRRILEDTRPGVGEQLRAAAALKPKLFEELYRVWGHTRPADDIARSALQFDYSFTPVAAKRFLSVYDEAMGFLPHDLEDSVIVADTPSVEAKEPELPELGDASSKARPQALSTALNMNTSLRRDVFALDEGEVTVTMPKSLSRASFEDFSAWIDLVRRKAERSVED